MRDGSFVHRKGRKEGYSADFPQTDFPQKPFKSRWMSKELKPWRKLFYQKYRARVKSRMKHEDWSGIPRFRRTGGWLTW